ncbi:ribonuclease Z [Budviciaceae bacterium BWR-B9]|uniref:Ribonuclease BN n=1 Tax=Limnobaculum allomyrinae TaxID=2791986 RepID=A0ABS1IVE0_9GAMM|nr:MULTISPECIES: ribonuclease Z [Limnobaculum]MBK5145725.1 ribonuclease Z [Limnobaculum allomyrinae]MBV7693741.1 ribonuclease Z [Limnobaculum sp. M2-1]
MELIFLGTGAGTPSKERNVSSLVLNLLSERNSFWMFDCGEGTQHQILHSSIRIGRLEKIFITHLHGDHIFGLPGLLSSRSMAGSQDPLTLYGPPGIKAFVETALNLSGSYLTYPLEIIEIQPGKVMEDQQFCVTALPLMHGIESFGYRIEEADKPGTLNASRLLADGVPVGPVFQRLKMGGQVQLDDGRVINGQDYLGPAQKGRVLAIFGDTSPCDNSLVLAKDANVMVHETTLEASMAEQANSRGHSTTQQTAELAKAAGAKRLIITHFSARYGMEESQRLLVECQEIFPQTEMASDLAIFTL